MFWSINCANALVFLFWSDFSVDDYHILVYTPVMCSFTSFLLRLASCVPSGSFTKPMWPQEKRKKKKKKNKKNNKMMIRILWCGWVVCCCVLFIWLGVLACSLCMYPFQCILLVCVEWCWGVELSRWEEGNCGGNLSLPMCVDSWSAVLNLVKLVKYSGHLLFVLVVRIFMMLDICDSWEGRALVKLRNCW